MPSKGNRKMGSGVLAFTRWFNRFHKELQFTANKQKITSTQPSLKRTASQVTVRFCFFSAIFLPDHRRETELWARDE